MMKFPEFLRFGVILKPKNQVKYSRLFNKSHRELKEKKLGSEL